MMQQMKASIYRGVLASDGLSGQVHFHRAAASLYSEMTEFFHRGDLRKMDIPDKTTS